VSVALKPIERHRVSTCLQVFSEKTHTALLTHPSLDTKEVKDTAAFIYKVLQWWKILNVKTCGADTRRNDPYHVPIVDPEDQHLLILKQFGVMAMKMTGKQGFRVRQLSKDTAAAIYQTCYGLVDLCRHLLASSHEYVLLGQFTTYHIEKEYSKLRQGSGGAYFLTVQQIIEKVPVKQASLLLKCDENFETSPLHSGHQCKSCDYILSEEGTTEIFDGLPDLEPFIPGDAKMSLVYMAGYITRNDEALEEEDLLGHTKCYFEKYDQFTKTMDRGGLKVPTDQACQWTFFCFILFHTVKDEVCRKSLSNLFKLISEFYDFVLCRNMKECHCLVFSNILLNKLCRKITPRSSKEPALKVLKLSKCMRLRAVLSKQT